MFMIEHLCSFATGLVEEKIYCCIFLDTWATYVRVCLCVLFLFKIIIYIYIIKL